MSLFKALILIHSSSILRCHMRLKDHGAYDMLAQELHIRVDSHTHCSRFEVWNIKRRGVSLDVVLSLFSCSVGNNSYCFLYSVGTTPTFSLYIPFVSSFSLSNYTRALNKDYLLISIRLNNPIVECSTNIFLKYYFEYILFCAIFLWFNAFNRCSIQDDEVASHSLNQNNPPNLVQQRC